MATPEPDRTARTSQPLVVAAAPRRSYIEETRVRLGYLVCLALTLTTIAIMLLSLLERRWFVLLLAVPTLAVSAAATLQYYRIRRTRAVHKPGLLLLGWCFAIVYLVACVDQGLAFSISPWPPLLALFAIYMLGARLGLIFIGLAVVQVGVAFALHRAGVSLPIYMMPWDATLRVLASAIAMVLIGMLGHVYERSQQHTLIALEDALAISEQNERQLDAVFESATAAICSFDRAGRLLVHNGAFAAMVAASDARPPRPPRPGDALAELLDPAQHARWQPHIAAVLAGGGPATFEEPPAAGQDGPYRETALQPIVVHGQVAGVTAFCRDITARKRAEAEMARLHRELVRVSRRAGMASVAGEVLHNAGNVLNSAGVSVSMLERHVHNLKTGHLSKAVALIEEHAGDLATFVRDDPTGQRLLELLRGLAEHFQQQQRQLAAELTSLRDSTDHLTRVIHAQQGHARSLGVIETVSVAELVDAVLDLQAATWVQLGIAVEREIPALPPLNIDRHKVLEILVNLVSNARHALRDSGRSDKRLRIRAEAVDADAGSADAAGAGSADAADAGSADAADAGSADATGAGTGAGAADAAASQGAQRVRIHIEDNGAGIAPEVSDRLFRLGFTTKPDGSGIGLHSSANTAQQLGGALWFRSNGPGQGAVFTLELPLAPRQVHARSTPGPR
jgi:two-component system sensor kinase FixL